MKLCYKIKKKFFCKNFVLFALIGVVNFFVYNSLYILLIHIINYVCASLLAGFASMTSSFFLNSKYNFKVKPTIKNYILFPISNIPNFLMQTFGIILLVEKLHIKPIACGIISSFCAVPFTFILISLLLKEK